MISVLKQYAELTFFNDRSLKQHPHVCRSSRTHYAESDRTQPTFAQMLRASRSKYQLYSLSFDATGYRTHDLLY